MAAISFEQNIVSSESTTSSADSLLLLLLLLPGRRGTTAACLSTAITISLIDGGERPATLRTKSSIFFCISARS